jgi:hypothetical protein
MPGATETDFFERADMMDTKIGQAKKDDPAEVARLGFEAMMKGEGEVITGWQNKLRSAIAHVLPAMSAPKCIVRRPSRNRPTDPRIAYFKEQRSCLNSNFRRCLRLDAAIRDRLIRNGATRPRPRQAIPPSLATPGGTRTSK